MINNYNKVSSDYQETHGKPDKKYSMAPTILQLAKPLKNKTIIDVGCGDGFFTQMLAKKAKFVYGIDNSEAQIQKAKNTPSKNYDFILADMFDFEYPKADVINTPFVLGYLKSKIKLEKLSQKYYQALNKKGKIIGIIDFPKYPRHNNQKFGSIKKIDGKLIEGAKLDIELYNNNMKIVTLHAYYHTKATIERALENSGFKSVKWHEPIISKEGIKAFGLTYWREYLNNIDIAYFTAIKG